MTEPCTHHRLDGLEPDNLLAFLALLGLLRALETARPDWRPRAAWDIENPPLRPFLVIAKAVNQREICSAAVAALSTLFVMIDFGTSNDLKMEKGEATKILCRAAARQSACAGGFFADFCAALVSDGVLDQEQKRVEPTPFAYPSVATSNFLRNAIAITKAELPEKRGRDRSYPSDTAECLAQALFMPWQRRDRPVGLRWDPDEAKRHAHQWRAPTKDPPTTQHGANRLAIAGLSAVLAVPMIVHNRPQLSVIGGEDGGDRFSFAWPIWRSPASLAAVRALLSHPELRTPQALEYLGVDHVRVTRRISLDRLRNFTVAEPRSGCLQEGRLGGALLRELPHRDAELARLVDEVGGDAGAGESDALAGSG
ncbi:MAG TPA: hypothetical protein VME41_18250 [Stellaceae bacterium]|nr:hypothetical protein [Stellaceae bacterium]